MKGEKKNAGAKGFWVGEKDGEKEWILIGKTFI